MAEQTEHQCISEEQARKFAIQQIVRTVLKKKSEYFVAVCDHCRNLIAETIRSVSPDELSKFSPRKKELGNWETKLESAVDELNLCAESYLEGKRIVQGEGIDLNDIKKVIERLEFGLAVYHEKKKLYGDKFEMFDEIHVCFYLTALLSRDMIKTVLGDEAHLAEHAHTAKEYCQSI